MSSRENLSSDGAGLLMMVGRLLTMIEADQLMAAERRSEATGPALLRELGLDVPPANQTAVEAAIVELVQRSREADTATRSAQRKAVIDRYEADTLARQQQQALVAGSDQRPAATTISDPQARFTAYLSKQAGRSIGPLKKFHRIAGGYSKTTLAAELEPQDDFGWGTRLLIRMDVADGPTNFTVADEYPLLKRLHGSAVPVAQPFACESDITVLGQAFLVSALLPGISAASGDPTVAAWGQDLAQRRNVGLQLAQALGALHSVTPDETDERSGAEQLRRYLQEWRQVWLGLGAPPSPGLALAFDWLEENAPQSVARLAYIHGDFAPYNALQLDGQLTAVIDWEFIHLGDPAEDVGYCRKYMESLLPWDEFLQAYYAAGGPEYRSESASFYEVWCNVRNAVVLLQGRQAYVSGRNRDVKVLYAPAEFYDYFLLNALRSIRTQL